MTVRPLTADEWQLKRDLRLTALKDSPAAFASTYAREAHRSESEWRDWPRGGEFFAAFAGPVPPDPVPPGPVPLGPAASDGVGPAPAESVAAAAGPSALGPVASDVVAPAFAAPGSAGPGHWRPGAPLGIAGAWVTVADPTTTHLISMWVAPEARGNGVAGLLIDAVAGWAAGHGCARVELEVAAGNEAAMKAYLRAGFTIADHTPFTDGGTVLIRPVQ
ncbi:GNAT family N-acetyltransferase [Dactylosporangium sp. CA-092794]|uniref:GNAT family N-acetyltransferase n=1 Tax=Dactylosporangium sp. CA-092794 TaxID=3239929 RepID=UPI003D92C0BC